MHLLTSSLERRHIPSPLLVSPVAVEAVGEMVEVAVQHR